MNLEHLFDQVVPSAMHCRESADALRRTNPGLSNKELAARAIHTAKIRAATAGAATGVASSPLTMVPAALADMIAVLAIEGALVGTLAALLAPDTLDDPHAIKADIISVIFPAAASQALRQLGIRAGERLSQAAVRKYASEDFFRFSSRLVAKYLGKGITREGLVKKAVPLVGMGIGAGWNWMEVKAIGARAMHYYANEPIEAEAVSAESGEAEATPKGIKKLWPAVRRLMPGKSKE